MRLLLTVLLMALSGDVFSQRQGIGVRLGDPMAISYKKYAGKSRAVEFGLGSAPAHWHNRYYFNSFDEYSHYDAFQYQNHSVQRTVYLQARYLFQYPIPVENMEGTLDWYWGVGGLLKVAKVKYVYRDIDSPFNSGADLRMDVDIGPEGILGMEYTFRDTPVTVFGEGSLMIEFLNRPLALRSFAGVGFRYNF